MAERAVPGYIYVLRADLPGRSSVVKIGMTTRSVAKRIRELSTGSPVALKPIYVLPVVNPLAVERYLHSHFAAYRMNSGGSEFFRIDPGLVVRELDRIATEVSKERAREARDAELRTFKERIGAAHLERRIRAISWAVPLALLVVGLVLGAQQGGPGVFIVLAPPLLFIVAGIFSAISTATKWVLGQFWFKPRFGAQIAARWEDLRRKFPLAYEKPGHIPVGVRIGRLPDPANTTIWDALESFTPLVFLAGLAMLILALFA